MAKVAIVTDSTSDIPESWLEKYPIHIVPLKVIFGEETYSDGVDISANEFYSRLETSTLMPSTSQPNPSDFLEIYKDLLDDGFDIISIHISLKLSATLNSAKNAAKALNTDRIFVIDSTVTCMALGLQVETLAKAALAGATLEECKTLANSTIDHVGALFVVETLEFLKRGGRIGGAAAFLGTALNLKPILELQDGKIEAVERVRTMSKAIAQMVKLLEQRLTGKNNIRLAVVHATNPKGAEKLADTLKEKFQIEQVSISDLNSVLGTHVGPGTLSVTFLSDPE
ncbi:MAG: DegV family protein [Anaerolineaceae bacterium]|nr:DegV family protein [Anaerolineaceae bacterium]